MKVSYKGGDSHTIPGGPILLGRGCDLTLTDDEALAVVKSPVGAALIGAGSLVAVSGQEWPALPGAKAKPRKRKAAKKKTSAASK